ncbi:dipeptidase PepV [Halobacillus litoralis]|uniref:dipeptidase PepV n=1 Tax=Halobacillus litoralis TaxID=45668 RepID=UPI002491AD1A|nr:dipeptidase PepV [Halobacillus litoralis]
MNFNTLSKDYKEEYIKKAFELLKIPSVFEESDRYPYGKAIDDVLDKALSIAEDDGFVTKNVDGHGGHIEFGEGEDLIGILGHLDVVPAGEGWSSNPFEPVVKDNKLYARGAQDDKGPVMAAYIAMKLLKDQGFHPKKRVRLILGSDEERDWKGIEYYFKEEEMPAVGFTPDASFPVIHAEKGLLDCFITFEMEDRKDGKIEILQLAGGDRLNMVPEEATAVLKTADNNLKKKLKEYKEKENIEALLEVKDGRGIVKVKGKAVHASKPEEGQNAITGLLGFLLELPLSSTEKGVIRKIHKAFLMTDGEGLDIKRSDKVSGPLTSNLGSIEFHEGTCKVGFNLRYPVTVEYETVLECLERVVSKMNGTLKVYDHLPSIHLDKGHPFVETLLDVYNSVTGERLSAHTIGGATYARALDAGVAYGALFADSPDTAHQKDEHVLLDDMVRAIEIYATCIYELTK